MLLSLAELASLPLIPHSPRRVERELGLDVPLFCGFR